MAGGAAAAAAAAAPAKETPQERLKRIMQAQLNKQAQKDVVVTQNKKLQVSVLGGWADGAGRSTAGCFRVAHAVGWRLLQSRTCSGVVAASESQMCRVVVAA